MMPSPVLCSQVHVQTQVLLLTEVRIDWRRTEPVPHLTHTACLHPFSEYVE
jgi:hypothetical protein